jgi:hypothetical protein
MRSDTWRRARDDRVGFDHGDHRHKTCRIGDAELVVEDELAKRPAGLLHWSLAPEPGGQRLSGCARRARARADLLDLVVLTRPPLAAEGRWPVGPITVGRTDAERPPERQVRADCRRRCGRQPDTGDRRVRRRVRERRTEAVVGALGVSSPATFSPATPSSLAALLAGIEPSDAVYAGSMIVGA